jgi:hypothetical protein
MWAEFVVIYSVLGVLMWLAIAGALWLASESCAIQATKIDRPYTWGVLSGCMIEAKPGQWIPLKNYRVIGDK